MLVNLSVNNIVLISSLNVEFSRGLCVLTGETGAGKSIILDALALALGIRAEKGLIRRGENKAVVIAEFDKSVNSKIEDIFEEFGLDYDSTQNLILRRVLTTDVSKAFVNDMPVTVKILNKIGNRLVEIHGQFENHGLMNRSSHIEFLDKFAGNKTLLLEYKNSYNVWQNTVNALIEAEENLKKATRDEEYITHCVKELEKLNAVVGEDTELALKRRQLMSLEKNFELIKEAYQALNQGKSANENVRQCQNILLRSGDELLNETIDRLAFVSDEILEISDELERTLKMQINPVEELESTEERLFALKSLARKHQVSVDELPALTEKFRSDLNLINKTDETLNQLKRDEKIAKENVGKIAEDLHNRRVEFAEKFENEVACELAPLKLEKAKFKVNIERGELGAKGCDVVDFRVAMNSGMDYSPLDKTASGGELVRLMLALKVVLKVVNPVPVMVFDEVDTGISGAVSSAVGERLKKLGQAVQVLVITHSAQVAGCGDYHYKIEKYDENGETFTNLKCLDNEQRVNEVARLISGAEITEAGILMANQLLKA